MENSKDLSEGVIFPKGEKIISDYFTGSVWLQTLVASDSIINGSIGNITFEPGARNNWHKHSVGQILLVTGGKGYFQEEGKSRQIIKEGEVIKIQPNVKHWHGAAPDSWLVHIAISMGDPVWLEPVTDEEYDKK